MRFRLIVSLLFASTAVAQQQNQSPGDTIARWFSSTIREYDAEIRELDKHLANLPESGRTRVTNRVGYHSAQIKRANRRDWVQVDLREEKVIDGIALVPLKTETALYPEGYGFPLRFKVEIANKEDFSDAEVVYDQTSKDFPNPGDYPVLVKMQKKKARFVRVTSLKHYPTLDGFIWGLGELMVLSGNYNVAAGKPVTAESSMHLPNTWAAANLTDSHSTIGMPVTNEQSPTNGWLSGKAKNQNDNKWVEIDLGELVKVDEIRIVPAQPTDLGDTPGIGFPVNFRLTAGANSGEDLMVFDSENRYYVNPQGNAMIFEGPEIPIRYIKLRATRIQIQGAFASLALSEIQAYSNGENVALGAEVEVSDSQEMQKSSRWAKEYLVDGFTSQYRLTEFPEYLDSLEERRKGLMRKAELRRERNQKTEQVLTALAVVAAATFLGLSGFLGAALSRQRRVRKAESNRLRTQIARDLHDDIGSNLGSIALTSQIASGVPGLSEEAKQDFEEIHKTAENTAESMRDIVWLIDTGNTTFEDLFTKMRDAASRLLTEVEFTFTADLSNLADHSVSLRFRRHVFFAFKEALNNIRKHADASKVAIEVSISGGQLRFRIEDDGTGFDMDTRRKAGRGVTNVMDRAQRIGGVCEFTTKPECGTVVLFEVPLKSSREH